LYVGLGTFAPVRQEDLLEHKMHHETFEISRQSLNILAQQHKRQGRIIPVGTTAMRLIESLARTPLLPPNNTESALDLAAQGEVAIPFEQELLVSHKSQGPEETSAPVRGHITWSQQKNSLQGSTSLFISPGFSFLLSDGLITNFHTPKSTLVMLVSAFYQRQKILGAYELARTKGYRFFSYGDAMFIE
jgi:S-adenosylmethionine:tRNA ribosyltransferase-isomerase